jgi:hypothetical protein
VALVVEILAVSVSMANELFFLIIAVEILALLVDRKSQPLRIIYLLICLLKLCLLIAIC